MTGFASVDLDVGGNRYAWELRTVNGRGLEVRFRLPPGFERLEPDLRRLVRGIVSRGNCQFSLLVDKANSAELFELNENALALAVAVAKRLAGVEGITAPSADGILSIPGVLQPMTGRSSLDEDTTGVILSKFREGLDKLKSSRADEGKRLAQLVSTQLDALADLVERASAAATAMPDLLKTRIAEQIRRIDEEAGLDRDRLHQESVLLAVKADVNEEIDRLRFHIAAAREHVAAGAAVGRRLDFLAQEMNREANTICSKAIDTKLSTVGVDMKTVVDQFREQVQNIE